VHKVGNKIECNNMHGERIKIENVSCLRTKRHAEKIQGSGDTTKPILKMISPQRCQYSYSAEINV